MASTNEATPITAAAVQYLVASCYNKSDVTRHFLRVVRSLVFALDPPCSDGGSGSGSGSSSTAVPPSTSPSAPASAGSASSPPTTLAAAVAQMGIRGVLVDERWARQYQQVCAYLHAEENPSFWLAVEEYRRLPDLPRLAVAESIFRRHLSDEAVQQVNVSSGSITGVADSLRAAPPDLFDACQAEVLRLMEESAKTNDLDELVREASAEEGPTGAATSSSALPSLSLGKFRFGGGGSGGADSSGSGEKGDAGTQVGSNAAADDDGDRTGLKSPRAAVSKLAGTLRGLGAKK
jgi:hypothetical protein